MDYSLLVGLHFYDGNTYDKMALSPFLLRSGNWPYLHCICEFVAYLWVSERVESNVCGLAGQKDSYQNEKFMRGCRFLEAELQDMDRVLSGRYVLMICDIFL